MDLVANGHGSKTSRKLQYINNKWLLLTKWFQYINNKWLRLTKWFHFQLISKGEQTVSVSVMDVCSKEPFMGNQPSSESPGSTPADPIAPSESGIISALPPVCELLVVVNYLRSLCRNHHALLLSLLAFYAVFMTLVVGFSDNIITIRVCKG